MERKKIIIAEKESVALNYQKALNLKKTGNQKFENADGTVILTYAAGHLYELKEPEDYNPEYKKWTAKDLPIIPEKLDYKKIDEPNKNRIRKNLEEIIKEGVKENSEIIIATDPDREGEVIARIILAKCGVKKENITRIWMCEGLDKETILKGIRERKKDEYYDGLADQGFAQKECDWLFGYNLSRAVTLAKDKDVMSVGRVQTATLNEIHRNEMSRKLFVSKPYYQVRVKSAFGTKAFLSNRFDGSNKFNTKEEAEKAVEEIKGNNNFKCVKYEEESKRETKPLLYSLSTLQQDANRLFSIKAKTTLDIAQSLYNEEGVSSYPRTDSQYVSEDDYEHFTELMKKLKEKDERYVKCLEENNPVENRRVFNKSKTTGHHAIIPTNYMNREKSEKYIVYDLIARRFMMQWLKDYEYYKQESEYTNGKYVIKAEGKRETERGWKLLEIRIKGSDEVNEIKERIGDEVSFDEFEILSKRTMPEPLYTEATLLNFMKNPGKVEEGLEEKPIGTPATQASIIEKLFERKYIKNEGKSIRITDKGIELCEFIMDYPLLMENTGIETTARWEKLGKEDPQELRLQIKNAVKELIGELNKEMETVAKKKIIGECPCCHRDIIRGKYGYYCEGIKEGCTNSLSYKAYGNTYDDEKVKRLLEEKKLDVEEGITKDGNNVKYYFRIDEEGKIVVVYMDSEKEICSCPKCGKRVFEKKMVFKCEDKEGCDFFVWKETSGIKINAQMCKKLCEGEKTEGEKTTKDGRRANVELELNKEKWTLEFTYKN